MSTVNEITAGTKPPGAPCTRSFPAIPESVSAARSFVAGFFPAPAAAADAALLTSELFTNAILHSASRLPGSGVVVSVASADGNVRIDIVDDGQLPPSLPRHPGLGQGLALVATLADVFGADGPDRWFTLSTGGAR